MSPAEGEQIHWQGEQTIQSNIRVVDFCQEKASRRRSWEVFRQHQLHPKATTKEWCFI
jgi:hypothetical protein